MIFLGFDTSNYTTSVAAFDGAAGENLSRLLPVKAGELGLRQSEALFSHVKRLPELSVRLFANLDPASIAAVGVSTRPRAVEGSYMPCFLAGESQARVLAAALHVPLFEAGAAGLRFFGLAPFRRHHGAAAGPQHQGRGDRL